MRGLSSGSTADESDTTLIGEDLQMTSATPHATLFLELFDENSDEDKLIGQTEIKLQQYANSDDLSTGNDSKSETQWLTLAHPKKNAGSNRGKIRVGISFEKHDLGPGAMRSLNSTLTQMMEAPTWGLVNLFGHDTAIQGHDFII